MVFDPIVPMPLLPTSAQHTSVSQSGSSHSWFSTDVKEQEVPVHLAARLQSCVGTEAAVISHAYSTLNGCSFILHSTTSVRHCGSRVHTASPKYARSRSQLTTTWCCVTLESRRCCGAPLGVEGRAAVASCTSRTMETSCCTTRARFCGQREYNS